MKKRIVGLTFLLAISSSLFADDTAIIKDSLNYEISQEDNLVLNTNIERVISTLEINLPYDPEPEDECTKAIEDAQELHFSDSKLLFHRVLGFVLPGFSIAGTAIIAKPKLADAKYLNESENKDLFNNPEYVKCYEKRAKNELIMQEVIGTCVALLVYLSIATILL